MRERAQRVHTPADHCGDRPEVQYGQDLCADFETSAAVERGGRNIVS